MSITTGASARSYIQLLFHDTVSPSITKWCNAHVVTMLYKLVNNLII
jgi:hypothetical protein